MRKRKKSLTIRVSNQVSRRAKFENFSPTQIRMLFWAMSKLKDLDSNLTLRLPLRQFCAEAGLEKWVDNRNLHKIREAVVGLAKSFFFYQDSSGGWIVPLMKKVRVPSYIEGEEMVFKFNEDALEYFTALVKDFTIVHLSDLSSISSPRAIRLALMFSYMRHLNSSTLRTMPLEDLRFVLDMKDGAYDRWDNLWVALTRAHKEVDEHAKGLQFLMQPVKKGTKVVAVRFDPKKVVQHANRKRSITP